MRWTCWQGVRNIQKQVRFRIGSSTILQIFVGFVDDTLLAKVNCKIRLYEHVVCAFKRQVTLLHKFLIVIRKQQDLYIHSPRVVSQKFTGVPVSPSTTHGTYHPNS